MIIDITTFLLGPACGQGFLGGMVGFLMELSQHLGWRAFPLHVSSSPARFEELPLFVRFVGHTNFVLCVH